MARYWGRTDMPLSAAGERQAGRLAQRLAVEDIGVVYSSDLRRALDTARPIAAPAPPPPVPPLETLPAPGDPAGALLQVLASPTIADKQWVFRQYDHMVQVNTVFLPGADAAVLRIKGSKKALAMTLDGNGLYTRLDPRTGGRPAELFRFFF